MKSNDFKNLASKQALYPQEQLATVKKSHQSLCIGLPKEIEETEYRVCLTPESIVLLVNNGHEVIIETGAGLGSKFLDREYSEAGAQIVYTKEEVYKADIIIRMEPPCLDEINLMRPGQTLFSAFQFAKLNQEYFKALCGKKINAIAFEILEDKVGGKPIVRAMSEISGSTVMLIAGEYLNSVTGGKGIILGGITGVPPTSVVIIGAGTVAEYAARSAHGLGAEVKVFDNQIFKLKKIKENVSHSIYTSVIDTNTLQKAIKEADVVIGALRAEDGQSAMVVSEEMVSQMKAGAVIIDVSADQGGNFETTCLTSHTNPTFTKYDVIHYCVPNLASRVGRTASVALSHILTPMLLQINKYGGIEEMIYHKNWFSKGVYVYKGSLTNLVIARKFNLGFKDLSLLITPRY